ncbi:hypothetical protein EDC04DRAFT_2888461 [Pisolithus marmoratus]|nr:hypothetical protein EDC04DRAFT_2888461 [Pisolithus marmoratus]
MDDLDWQRDPNELDALAALTLKGSSSNNAADVANTANTANATDAADVAETANVANAAGVANAADTVIQDPLLSSPPLSPHFIPHATCLAHAHASANPSQGAHSSALQIATNAAQLPPSIEEETMKSPSVLSNQDATLRSPLVGSEVWKHSSA